MLRSIVGVFDRSDECKYSLYCREVVKKKCCEHLIITKNTENLRHYF